MRNKHFDGTPHSTYEKSFDGTVTSNLEAEQNLKLFGKEVKIKLPSPKEAADKLSVGVKKVVNNIKTGIATVANNVKDAAADLPFAPLLPFKKLMTDFLDQHGVSHSGVLHEIVILFAKTLGNNPSFVSGNHYEGFGNSLNANLVEEAEVKPVDFIGAAVSAGTGNPGQLISLILKFFKQLKAKKEAGKPLTAIEQTILDKAEAVVDNVTQAAKDAAEDTVAAHVKEFIFSWKGGLTLVGIITLLYFALKKK